MAQAEDILQRNISLIYQIYPHYQQLLSPYLQQESPYEIVPISEKAYSCRLRRQKLSLPQQRGNDEWIHGPDDPWKHAEQELLRAHWQEQSLFIILRPGLGYFPFLLYPNLRRGRQAQRLLLVEDRIDLFVESLKRIDWTDVLRSDRTILLLTDDPVREIQNFFQTNPVAILPPLAVLCGSNESLQEKQLMHQLQLALTNLSQTIRTASQEYLNDLQQHYGAIQRLPQRRRKILFVEPEHDYLADSIAAGFEGEGCVTEKFEGNQRMLHFLNPYVWLVYTREHYPDVLLWMNRNTLSPEGVRILTQFPIKKVLWFLDNPKRVETSREELDATDYYFSFDSSYLPYLKDLSGKEGVYLPTAAGIEPLPENRPGQIWQKRTGAEVGFVGALAASRYQDVLGFWKRRDPEFVRILNEIVDDYLNDPAISLEKRYKQSPAGERLSYSGFVVLYLEERATYLRRLNFLRAVQDQGLITFGSPEWSIPEWAQELTRCYAGYAPKYREDLPGVYFQTKININVFHVQCINSTNPRIYDVLAAGGFLLTEYRQAVEEEFEEDKHLVFFRSPEELREKVDYYLSHDQEREEIARTGQRYALEHASYQQRIRKMLEEITCRNQNVPNV